MSVLVLFALSAAASNLSQQFARDLQTCVLDTSKIWSSKPGSPDQIVDMAEVYCHEKLDKFLISQKIENRKIGLNEAQSDEYNAILAASLIRINRRFAIEKVQSARSK